MSEPTGRRRLRRDTLDELLWTLRGRRGWLVGLGINLALGVAYALYTAFNANDHFFIQRRRRERRPLRTQRFDHDQSAGC